jgi:hypothetical protein
MIDRSSRVFRSFQLHLRLGNYALPPEKTLPEALGWIEFKRKDLSLIPNEEVLEAGGRGRDGT